MRQTPILALQKRQRQRAALISAAAQPTYPYRNTVIRPPENTKSGRRQDDSGRISERLVAAAPRRDAAETLEAIVRIHSALSEDLEPSRIAQRLVDETTPLTGASGGAFYY